MTSEQPSNAVLDLIDNCTLKSIECYEVSARRSDAVPVEEDRDDEVGGEFSVVVQQRSYDGGFGIRLVGTATMPIGEAIVSIAGEYELTDGHTPSQRSLQIFTNEVGVMTIFPYLREAISTVTARVFGEPLLLPMVRRGQISIDVDPE